MAHIRLVRNESLEKLSYNDLHKAGSAATTCPRIHSFVKRDMHIIFETSLIIARAVRGGKAPGDGKTWS